MLDPNRYSLDAATVGFRKRMKQSVNWGNFTEALQTQSESIKVRRELQETPISEVHVMGGERYGWAGNSKTNEMARQERQINGYPLRSFYATGGAIVLPVKHTEGLLATPMNVGLTSYAQYNGVVGNYVSSFTEPLNAPMDSGTMLMARAGRQARSEAINNPYKFLQFQLNMHATQQEIQKNEAMHKELRGYNKQANIAESVTEENAKLAKAENVKQLQTHAAIKKAGATHAPGSGTATYSHLPNVWDQAIGDVPRTAADYASEMAGLNWFAAGNYSGASGNVIAQNEQNNEEADMPNVLENPGLLDQDGERVADLAENAAEEQKTGIGSQSVGTTLRQLGPEDDQFLLDTERSSPFVRAVFQKGTESMRESLIQDILYYKQRGISPEQAAVSLTTGSRESYMALQAVGRLGRNRSPEDQRLIADALDWYDFHEGVAGDPADEVATRLADSVVPSGPARIGPGSFGEILKSWKRGRDALEPVELVNNAKALTDSKLGYGANGLQIQYGGMESTAIHSTGALTPFLERNATDGSSLIENTEVADYMSTRTPGKITPTNLNFISPASAEKVKQLSKRKPKKALHPDERYAISQEAARGGMKHSIKRNRKVVAELENVKPAWKM